MYDFSRRVIDLIKVFFTEIEPQKYHEMGKRFPFPDAPGRCPFSDCKMPVKLKKHGFYTRNYIGIKFIGKILIRRYICPVCGRTICYIPSFCIPYYQYCGELIAALINGWSEWKQSLNSYLEFIRKKFPNLFIDRQHLYFYTKRFTNNYIHICTGLRQIDSGAVIPNKETDKKKRAHEVLNTIQKGYTSIHAFSQRFFEACQKSFMAPCTLF